MNKAIYNANTCISYKLAFYRYTLDLNMYSSINNAYTDIFGSNNFIYKQFHYNNIRYTIQ